jgi:hypothetical protein
MNEFDPKNIVFTSCRLHSRRVSRPKRFSYSKTDYIVQFFMTWRRRSSAQCRSARFYKQGSQLHKLKTLATGLPVPLGNFSCRWWIRLWKCVQCLHLLQIRTPLVGCCVHGNELFFFLVQNKTVMNLWCRFEGRKCIDDVHECRLLIGSSPWTLVMSLGSVVDTLVSRQQRRGRQEWTLAPARLFCSVFTCLYPPNHPLTPFPRPNTHVWLILICPID